MYTEIVTTSLPVAVDLAVIVLCSNKRARCGWIVVRLRCLRKISTKCSSHCRCQLDSTASCCPARSRSMPHRWKSSRLRPSENCLWSTRFKTWTSWHWRQARRLLGNFPQCFSDLTLRLASHLKCPIHTADTYDTYATQLSSESRQWCIRNLQPVGDSLDESEQICKQRRVVGSVNAPVGSRHELVENSLHTSAATRLSCCHISVGSVYWA